MLLKSKGFHHPVNNENRVCNHSRIDMHCSIYDAWGNASVLVNEQDGNNKIVYLFNI